MENKTQYVLYIIDKISDLNFQRDVWVEGKYYDMVINHIEAINLLDDYQFFDDLREGRIKIPADELKRVIDFSGSLLSYNEEKSPTVLIDEKWREIVDKAKIALDILRKYEW